MGKPRFKKGDRRVLVRPGFWNLGSKSFWHVDIESDAIQGIFGRKYICRWMVEGDYHYEAIGFIPERRMIIKEA